MTLTDDEQAALWDLFMDLEEDIQQFEIEVVDVQKEKTFSAEALENLNQMILLWIGARLLCRWQDTEVPPTRLVVDLKVEIQ